MVVVAILMTRKYPPSLASLFFPPNQTPNSCSRIRGVRKQSPHPHLQVKRSRTMGTYFKTEVLARVLRMQSQSAPPPRPHSQHTHPKPPLYGDVTRAISRRSSPKAPEEVPLLSWGVPSGSPARGRGKLGATDSALAPHPQLISLPGMCI